MIKKAVFILFLCLPLICNAQYKVADVFTVEKGLRGNFIYKSLEDNKGFLWILTEAGLARFDGKKMQIFNSQHGIPDLNIIDILQDEHGIIWIIGSNNQVAYFDNRKMKFVNSGFKNFKDTEHSYESLFANSQNRIIMNTSQGVYTLKNNHLSFYPLLKSLDSSRAFLWKENGFIFRHRLKHINKDKAFIYIYLTNKLGIVDSAVITTEANESVFNPHDSSIYLFKMDSKSVMRISSITNDARKIKFQVENKNIIRPYYNFNFTNKYIVLQNRLGENIEADVYDNKTFKPIFHVKGDFVAWNIFNDHHNNLWVSTHTGLRLYKAPNPIKPLLDDRQMDSTFYSIANGLRGEMIIGSSESEVLEIIENKTIRHMIPTKNPEWQRSIIVSQNKIFSFSDGGIFVDYKKGILLKSQPVISKEILQLNDSIIIIRNDKNLYKLNTINEQVTQLKSNGEPIHSIASLDSNIIYIGSNDGLFRYNLTTDTYLPGKVLDADVTASCVTPDGLLWAGTIHGLHAIKNNNVIATITHQEGLLTNAISKLAAGKIGQIWLGTFSGISKIHYQYVNGKMECKVQNMSLIDGLSSTAINQLFYRNDTLYAATDKGVSYIPDSIPIPEIPIVVTRILINQKDTLVLKHFELEPNENNISIDFTGVELNGYFDHAQYSQDKGKTWTDLEDNNYKTEWQSGEHSLWFRAVDVNKNISKQITKLHFDIATHFYKSWWFWLSIAALVLAASIYVNTLLTKRKQQKQIDVLLNQQALDALEMQALKAQMNPHFVFNCLSSIKGFIYDEDFEKADTYLDKFSSLMRNTLDYSSRASINLQSELLYIETYLSLEKLRFFDKFDYKIENNIDTTKHTLDIPAMLLQPYVENAIKHGVCNLEERIGLITIKVYLASNKLHVEIEDNGVGREEANALKRSRIASHESKGTVLTERRIALYQIELRAIDKKDDTGQATGTLIHLIIPIPLELV